MRSVSNRRTNCSFNAVVLCIIHCLHKLHQDITEWIINPGSDSSQNQNYAVTGELIKLYKRETTDVTILRQALYPNKDLDDNCDVSDVLDDLLKTVPQLQQLFQFDSIFMCYCFSCKETVCKN